MTEVLYSFSKVVVFDVPRCSEDESQRPLMDKCLELFFVWLSKATIPKIILSNTVRRLHTLTVQEAFAMLCNENPWPQGDTK